MRLFNKGLLLVALPSLFGLVLLAALFYSQQQATRAVNLTLHSKDVLEQINDIVQDVLNESARFRGAILSKAPSMAPESFWIATDQKVARLEQAVQDNPAQLERASALRRNLVDYRAALARTHEITLAGDPKVIAERYQALVRSGALARLRATANAFLQNERQLEAERLAETERARHQQLGTMVLVVLCSLVVSIAASYLFARSIGGRLNILTGNAKRLAERRDLLPRVPGEDEIAELDKALHEASERLLEAERQQSMLQSERAARAHAEQAARLKDEFVITLSHELRTPLHSIIGWAEILKASKLDGERLHKGLDVIHRNAKLQAKMVNDLLEMSSILTGRVRLDLQRVSLAEVIEQVVLTVLPTAEAKQVRIVKIMGSAEPIQGDPSRLHQMVWNLLTNAVKFTPKGGKIQVSLSRVNSEVMVSVTDTGKGISPEFLPFVFDRFRQEDTGIGRQAGGLGLGLAIVRQLAELHGGRVEALSGGLDQGATFTLRFPVPSAHVAAGSASPSASSLPGHAKALQDTRILVVEDDLDARDLVVHLLEDAGAVVVAADGGAAALEILRGAAGFDIVLSDVGMPGMDGYEFVQRMRQLEGELGRAKLPVVALTALARTEDRQNALLAGFHAHVVKPVNPLELTIVLASALGRANTLGATVKS